MYLSYDGGLLDYLAELYFFCHSNHHPKRWDNAPPLRSTLATPLLSGPPITNASSQLIVVYSFKVSTT
jgi:hypothetical protein